MSCKNILIYQNYVYSQKALMLFVNKVWGSFVPIHAVVTVDLDDGYDFNSISGRSTGKRKKKERLEERIWFINTGKMDTTIYLNLLTQIYIL